MIFFLRIFRESYRFAFQAIIVNKLRTILSLLGITIGIFTVISVFTVVDSMESKIRTSIESLDNNVLFIQKWPWAFGGDYPWWKYLKRPVPKLQDMEEIQKRSQLAESAVFMVSTNRMVEYYDKNIENVNIVGVTHDFGEIFSFELSQGRYFSHLESASGKPIAIIGDDIANNLYNGADPIGRHIKIFGRKLEVIGVFKKEGENPFGNSPDQQVTVPVTYLRSFLNINSERYNPFIVVKAKPFVSNDELKNELTGIMRAVHKLKPAAEDDFAINEPSLLKQGFNNIFRIISIAGWIIGGFALLVGGFGIANIMFVSVRERTYIIGIQKSVGAKNYFILLQFLFEAVFLCLFGGIAGLFLVFIGTIIVSLTTEMAISMTGGNIIMGMAVSLVIGLISGLIPAYSASRLNPVVAIRTTF